MIWFMVHLILVWIVGWFMLKYNCQPIVYVCSMTALFFVGIAGYVIIHNIKKMNDRNKDVLTVVVVVLLAVIGMAVGWMLGEIIFDATR